LKEKKSRLTVAYCGKRAIQAGKASAKDTVQARAFNGRCIRGLHFKNWVLKTHTHI